MLFGCIAFYESSWPLEAHSSIVMCACIEYFLWEFPRYCCKAMLLHVFTEGLYKYHISKEVERGRYVQPKLDITERLCISCHVIKDEEHFVTDCVNNREIRKSFFEKISLREPGFPNWNNREKFVFLMSCEDPLILSWFSRFLYHSFHNRNLRTSLRV